MRKLISAVIAVLLIFIMALTLLPAMPRLSAPATVLAATDAAGLNKAYWPLNDKYIAALNSSDNDGIISSGQAIIDLFLAGADPAAKAAEWAAGGHMELDILRGVTESVAEAHEALGDYEKAKAAYELALPVAVAWQELNAPVDTEFVRTIMQNKIDSYNVGVSVYAEIQGEGGEVSYQGAKFEPKTGVYYGEVHTQNPAEALQSAKTPSAGLFYVRYETETIESFDWVLRPLAQTRDILEIAWNVAGEGSTLPIVPNESAKIQAAADYLASLKIPVLLRFGAEMNVWQNKADPEQFKTAFKLVSGIMKERALNVAMLWSPGATGHIETTYDMFYPGDEYVDWVGVSLYTVKYFLGRNDLDDEGQAMYGTDQYANPVKKLAEIVRQYGDRKPIILSECGVENYSVTNNEDVTDWAANQLRATYQALPMIYPQVKAILYFNTFVEGLNEANRYTLYDNAALGPLYDELTSGSYFLSKGQTASAVTYKKLETGVSIPANAVTLLTYAPYIKKPNISVTYLVDGVWTAASGLPAYKQTFDLSSLADGAHTITVRVASNTEVLSVAEFNVIKNGGYVVIQ
ncbi:MAG: hypothetical protein LBS19_05575 [Clostridiales bacterium]|jgi:hypothetical protein|nr:hypothetical protein [Clostridiales bacterium]